MGEHEVGIRFIVVYFEGHSDIEDGLMYEPPLHSGIYTNEVAERTSL